MACSVSQKGSSTTSTETSHPVSLHNFFVIFLKSSENPYQLHPEFMILKKHLVSFPLDNIFVGKTADFSDYFGNKSTSYLSSALPDRTSRHKFLQMYL